MKRSPPLSLALALALAAVSAARAACKIEQVEQLPVAVANGRLVVSAEINGTPERLMIDTGSPATVLSPDAARALGLDIHTSVSRLRMEGIGGEAATQVAQVRSLSFGKDFSLNNQPVIVAEREMASSLAGLVGRDMFQDYDIDVDVPHGVIRMLKPVGCSDGDMPYWAKGAYSEAPLEERASLLNAFRTDILLNGRAFPAVLDTGSPRTTVTPGAASLAGVTITSQGSIPAHSVGGLGLRRIPSFSGLFQSVGVGEEVVKNTRLFVADLWKYNVHEETGTRFGALNADPNYGLIGLDFFRSHHVLISNSHHKLYMTYEGGPIFLPAPQPSMSGAAAEKSEPGA